MSFRKLAATVGAALIVVGACTGSSGAGNGKGTVKIGVDLPLSGGEVANGEPTFNGVQLAVDEANAANAAGGYKLEINKQDDAKDGVHNPDQGATNAKTLVADAAVVGMVGPFNSNVARAIIPVTNEAGLAQCSPANTGVDLTKTGSEKYRPKNPNQRNYFRVATPDDVQGPAGAQYAFNDLGKKKAYVLDDTEAFGKGVADTFQAEFERLGGTVVKRDGAPKSTTDYTPFFTAVKGQVDVVYFGGTQVTGGGLARKQMVAAGMGDIPYVGPDGIADLGEGGAQGAFITLAGVDASNNVHGTVAGIHDIPDPAAFAAKYKAKFNKDPGAYSALAYACTQVLIKAIASAATAPDQAAIRKAVRDYVFTTTNKFDTVLGTISFDENGDSSQKFISFYKVDPAGAGGKGNWVFVKQQDFATTQ